MPARVLAEEPMATNVRVWAEEARKGGELDVGQLFDAHAPYLLRVVHRLTGASADVCEDIVQEVFVVAFRRRAELVDSPDLRGWLYRVTINVVRQRRRTLSRWFAFIAGFGAAAAHAADALPPDGMAIRHQQADRVHACIQELPLSQREVFVLFELECLEGEAIADIVGISVNTVWSRLRLARARFREVWAQRGGEL